MVEEPSVVIGGSDEREGYFLQMVMGATRMSDGRIVLLDAQSTEISFYDEFGTHLATTGGEGDGPGEFRRLMQLRRLPGDTLLVLSSSPGLTWLSSDGEFLRSRRLTLLETMRLPCRMAEGSWHVLEDQSLLAVLTDNFGFSPCPPSPEPPWRESALIARSASFDGSFDTLGILPGTERNSPNYRVYGKGLLLGIAPDRIYAGDNGADEILVLGLNGDTISTYPTPFAPFPVPEGAKTEDVRRWERPDGSVEVGNTYLYPENYPRFGRLLVDQTGFLWVMAYPVLVEPVSSWRLSIPYSSFLVEDGGARWRVLDRDGHVVAEVRTPPGLFPLEIGQDYVLGLTENEFDVQAIQLHALVR